MRRGWDLDRKPLIVFWESTRACMLKCLHCRAEAIPRPLPGELSTREAMGLVDQVADFGRPYPILVVTGGDCMMRGDLWDVVGYATGLGLRVSLAPSVTPLLDSRAVRRISESGVSMVSISIDSPWEEVHDSIRGIRGLWRRSVEVVGELVSVGVKVQVNTVVMRPTVRGLPYMVPLLKDLGVGVWEVFYLVPVGRAGRRLDLSPEEWEDVSNFLYDSSKHGVLVRTVEGPMFRRVVLARRRLEEAGVDHVRALGLGRLYGELAGELRRVDGEPSGEANVKLAGTRDGRGVVFVAYNGDVYPSGFLPIPCGNVRARSLGEIYGGSRLMRDLKAARFRGKCGECEFRDLCGGSRARAYAYTGDPLGSDPACPYKPGSYSSMGVGGFDTH